MKPLAQDRDAILRHAITQVKPAYFSWPIEEQEKYRVALPPDEWFRIQQIVLRALFQTEVTTEDELDATKRSLNDAQHALRNGTLLPLYGVGDDFFWLDENLGDRTLLDFATLYDYDIWDHRFQEETRKDESPEYVPQMYRGSLYLACARLLIEGRFNYAMLSMAAGYLRSQIEEAGYQQMQKLIPHHHVDGERHGRRTKTGTIWDQRIDAGGMEGQLQELRSHFWSYLDARYAELRQEFDSSAATAVWMIDRSTPEENRVHFVFSDKTALQHVRLRHFVHDCRSRHLDVAMLEDATERERFEAERFLSDSYAKIADTAI